MFWKPWTNGVSALASMDCNGIQVHRRSASFSSASTKPEMQSVAVREAYSAMTSPDPPNSARKSLSFWEPVPHAQHGLSIVDVNAGGEGKGRDRRREHVHQSEGWVVGHEVPAAFLQY